MAGQHLPSTDQGVAHVRRPNRRKPAEEYGTPANRRKRGRWPWLVWRSGRSSAEPQEPAPSCADPPMNDDPLSAGTRSPQASTRLRRRKGSGQPLPAEVSSPSANTSVRTSRRCGARRSRSTAWARTVSGHRVHHGNDIYFAAARTPVFRAW